MIRLNRIARLGLEKELRISEAKFRSFTENSPNDILQINEKGEIQYSNSKNNMDIIGKSIYLLFKSRYHEEVEVKIAKVFATGETQKHEVEGNGSKGNSVWYLSKVGPIYGDDGKVVSVIIDVLNISNRKLIEQKIRSSAERFNRWKNSNFIGILQFNSDGDIIDANHTFLKMLGYSKRELLDGKIALDKLTPEEFMSLDKKAFEEATIKGFWKPFEKEFFHKKGYRVPIIIGGSMFEETPNEFIVFIIDITERKNAFKKTKESENRLSLIYNNTNDSMVLIDVEEDKFTIESINQVALENLPANEYSREGEVVEGSLFSYFLVHIMQLSREDARFLMDKCRGIVKDEKTVNYTLEIIVEEVVKYYEGTITFIQQEDKINLLWITKDITEKIESKQNLQKAFNEVSDLKNQLLKENSYLHEEINLRNDYEDFVYCSDQIKKVLLNVEKVANTDVTVLISGETGTGKELIARAIQEGEIEIIGEGIPQKVNVRLITATNKDLKEEVLNNRFREDLFFRLNVFPLNIPPLREREGDIPLLVEYFVNKFATKYNRDIKYVSLEAMDYLKNHSWVGNVRELENLIERSVILSEDENLFLVEVANQGAKSRMNINHETLASIQRNHIMKVLKNCDWKIEGEGGAALYLDIKPSTLRDRIKKYGIKR